MLSSIIIDFYKSLMFFNSHYGHKSVSLTKKKGVHPLSSSYILGSKNNCAIIDPTQTIKAFIKSLYILQAFSKRCNTLDSTKITKERFVSKKPNLVFDKQDKDDTFLKSNLNLLIVSTNPDFSTLIGKLFQSTSIKGCSLSYCNEKWVGGLLTNWKQVSKSISVFGKFSQKFGDFLNQNNIYFPRFKKLHRDFQGFLYKPEKKQNIKSNQNKILTSHEKYSSSFGPFALTASTRARVKNREINTFFPNLKKKTNTLSTSFGYAGGNKSSIDKDIIPSLNNDSYKLPFKRKPDLIILINCNDNKDLIQEANNLNIPIIGIINSNTKPIGVTYPVPGNYNSIHFVYFFLKWVTRVLNNPDFLPNKSWI